MKVIARNTLQYDEYSSPNWVEGETYDATDDGTVLRVSSEQGTDFRFIGRARDFMQSQFDFVNTEETN